MRSIFWIGCTLSILFIMLFSGAVAEQVTNASQMNNQSATGLNVTESVGNHTANLTTNASEIKTANTTANLTKIAGAVKAVNGTNPAAKQDEVNGTLIPYVNDLLAYAQKSGKDAALSAIGDVNSNIAKDNIIPFAYDYEGKALALPYEPDQVGNNRIAYADSTGFKFVQQMRDVAKTGSGIVKYQDRNPKDQFKVENVTAYVANVDGTYWIGAGMFMKAEPKEANVTKITSKLANISANSSVSGNSTANETAVKA